MKKTKVVWAVIIALIISLILWVWRTDSVTKAIQSPHDLVETKPGSGIYTARGRPQQVTTPLPTNGVVSDFPIGEWVMVVDRPDPTRTTRIDCTISSGTNFVQYELRLDRDEGRKLTLSSPDNAADDNPQSSEKSKREIRKGFHTLEIRVLKIGPGQGLTAEWKISPRQ